MLSRFSQGIDFSQPSVNPPAPNLMNSDPTGAGDGGLLDGLELRTPSSSFQAPTEETASYRYMYMYMLILLELVNCSNRNYIIIM